MYDIIVIGSGGAALSCAIALKQKKYNVLIVSKTTNTASQTAQAQGGINAVISNSSDTIQAHINDTSKSAMQVGNEENIKYMCSNAKETIQWLDNIGVPFSRDENSNIAQRQMGGATAKRACYSSDYTGLKILQTLFDTAIKLEIPFKEEHMLLSIIKNVDKACGITALDIKTSKVVELLSQKIIIASGGYGGVYNNFTTNSCATTGDGLVSALNANASLSNMEFVQFHPTALKDRYILISESARGEGGYLVTKDEKRFVDELLPRDIVSRAIYKKLLNDEEIFLDVRHLGYDKIMDLMPQEYKLCYDFTSLKMHEDLIPITPASHYSMGGIKVDLNNQTTIQSLYAIGEVACNGVHGANRLGGNSLLEIITFGLKVACDVTIEKETKITNYDNKIFINDKNKIEALFLSLAKKDFYEAKDHLGIIMFEKVGLFKDDLSLNEALITVNSYLENFADFSIFDKNKNYNSNLKEYLEFENLLKLSKVIIKSALRRKESRGAHYRTDYTSTLDEYSNETVFKLGELND